MVILKCILILDPNIYFVPVFATTAANPRESSYATYWNEKRQTYLGDLYSIAWMENSDKVIRYTVYKNEMCT